MNTSTIVAGLQLHRFGVLAALAFAMLLFVPDLALVGALLLLLSGLGSSLGLVLVGIGAPPGAGVGARLGAGALLACVSAWLQVGAVSRSYWGSYVNVAQQVTGAAIAVIAGAVVMSLWLGLASATNALHAGERFRVPLMLFVLQGLVRCALMAVEAPPALQALVGLVLGLPGVWLYWAALGELRAALEVGTDELAA